MYDVKEVRREFPILQREVNKKPLCYLDNGASAQKPRVVIEAIKTAYESEYANVHRGLHYLSNLATDNFEAVREKIKIFLGAKKSEEVVFTSGSTEGLNLVSYGWAMQNLRAGDEIILSVMEHHANIVPWHFLRERIGISLKWVEPETDGSLPAKKVCDAVSKDTKLIAITHMSNVFGSVVDVKAICEYASKKSICVVVDGSQAAVHMPINVQDLGCDFYTITGHKLYGPSGTGALFIKKDRIEEMRPFMGGGSMIKNVSKDLVEYNIAPHKFEAGTPGIAEMIGFGTALDFISSTGIENIRKYESELTNYAMDKLTALNWLNIQGETEEKGAIFSFTISGHGHPHDISTILDSRGIAVRAGHHCCQPLMSHMNVSATCRASFGMYNTFQEVDKLVDGLKFCNELFNS